MREEVWSSRITRQSSRRLVMKPVPPLVCERVAVAEQFSGDDLADEDLVIAAEVARVDQATLEVRQRVGEERHPELAVGRADAGERVGVVAGAARVALHQR